MDFEVLKYNIEKKESKINFDISLKNQINYSTGEFAIRYSCKTSIIPRQQLSLNCIHTQEDRIQNKLNLMQLDCNRRIDSKYRDY